MEYGNEFSNDYLNGHPVITLDEVTSTNKFIELLLDKGSVESEMIILAKYQREGRGMSGNNWFSEPGKNLLMSLLHYPESLLVKHQFFLSKCCALAVSNAINKILGSNITRIKWPNDVYIKNNKTAGILIQSGLKGDKVQYGILGIGINVNQSAKLPENSTSLILEYGQKFDIKEVLYHVVQLLDGYLKKLAENNTSELNKLYYSRLIGYQKWLYYNKEGTIIKGKISEVLDDGHIVLELENSKLEKFAVKEISLIPAGSGDQPAY